MTARLFGTLVTFAMLAPLAVGEEHSSAGEVAAVVDEIVRTTPLVDGHNDAPWSIRSLNGNRLADFDFMDTTDLESPLQTDIARLRAGGVGGQFWSVWVPVELEGAEAVTAVLEQIDLVHRLVGLYPDDLELARTAADVRRIHGEGRIASMIGVEGGHSIDDSLAVLRQIHALGAGYMTLSHWDNNGWVDAATDAPEHGGLSVFGEAVVREMNRIGMLVDLSHVSAEAMHDALDLSRAPVIFSHSSARAINSHPRNVPDDVLERLPSNGGVAMVNFGAFFVSQEYLERSARYAAEKARLERLHPGDPEHVSTALDHWLEEFPAPKMTVADVADHIEHIRDVAGVDHVGLGSDFDGVASLPEGLEDVSGYPNLLGELLRRGWSRQDVAKVAGGNILRVMEEAERISAELRASTAPLDLRLEDVEPTTETSTG